MWVSEYFFTTFDKWCCGGHRVKPTGAHRDSPTCLEAAASPIGTHESLCVQHSVGTGCQPRPYIFLSVQPSVAPDVGVRILFTTFDKWCCGGHRVKPTGAHRDSQECLEAAASPIGTHESLCAKHSVGTGLEPRPYIFPKRKAV
jgi:hypothetical protein